MITEVFQYDFMVRALIAGAIIAVIAPLIGNFLVIRRLSLFADTLSHVALSGVAVGLILKTEPLITTIIVTVVVSILIDRLRSTKHLPGEAVLAMFLPGGLALSLVLIGLAKGINSNLFSYLFGSITTISIGEILLMVALLSITVVIVALNYNNLIFSSFDEESARVSGIPVSATNTLLVVLTAITVSISMRIVGVLLIGALMVTPVLTGMLIGRSFKQSLLLSIVIAIVTVIFGIFIAYYLNLPAGAAIVILSIIIFGVISLFK